MVTTHQCTCTINFNDNDWAARFHSSKYTLNPIAVGYTCCSILPGNEALLFPEKLLYNKMLLKRESIKKQ